MENSTPQSGPSAESDPPPLTRHQARLEAERLAKIERDKARFAQPGASGHLFDYALEADASPGQPHLGDFAVIDFETTGFSPDQGHRIIEIAVARVAPDGTVLDEFTTLLNPGGCSTGPVHVHGITDEDVLDAPTFAQVWPEFLRRLDGAAVVAHNAAFEERFLLHELTLARAQGIDLPEYRFNSVCTLSWSRATMETPNHKLGTVVAAAGIDFPDQHTALGDVRATAALLPHLLAQRGGTVAFHSPTVQHPELPSELGSHWSLSTRSR